MFSDFEGAVRQIIRDCAIISHYHSGISYTNSFQLTPYEKDIISDFIQEEIERDAKIKKSMFGVKSK